MFRTARIAGGEPDESDAAVDAGRRRSAGTAPYPRAGTYKSIASDRPPETACPASAARCVQSDSRGSSAASSSRISDLQRIGILEFVDEQVREAILQIAANVRPDRAPGRGRRSADPRNRVCRRAASAALYSSTTPRISSRSARRNRRRRGCGTPRSSAAVHRGAPTALRAARRRMRPSPSSDRAADPGRASAAGFRARRNRARRALSARSIHPASARAGASPLYRLSVTRRGRADISASSRTTRHDAANLFIARERIALPRGRIIAPFHQLPARPTAIVRWAENRPTNRATRAAQTPAADPANLCSAAAPAMRETRFDTAARSPARSILRTPDRLCASTGRSRRICAQNE